MARTKAEIDLLREGFIAGRDCLDPATCSCSEDAKKKYPYPKVTRPRVVEVTSIGDIRYFFTVNNSGDFCFSYARDGRFTPWYTRQQLEVIASLLPADTLRRIADSGKCGPTEEVDVE